ncbi:hypothetical protein [Bradyrhizobium sp. UFLA05-112]
MLSFIQLRTASAITTSVKANAMTIVRTEPGTAPAPAIKIALSNFNSSPNFNSSLSITDGSDWRTGGHLAGLQVLIDAELTWAAENKPQLIETIQQSLHRLFLLMADVPFNVPDGLTNMSIKGERTRLHKHEDRKKLLVELAEFLIGCAWERNERHVIIIDRACALSDSAKTLVKLLVRFQSTAALFRFVLIDYENCLYFPGANELHFGGSANELERLASHAAPHFAT